LNGRLGDVSDISVDRRWRKRKGQTKEKYWCGLKRRRRNSRVNKEEVIIGWADKDIYIAEWE
jgi:hypothetical protein